MNIQARRRIQVSQEHYFYQSSRHLQSNDYTAYDAKHIIMTQVITQIIMK